MRDQAVMESQTPTCYGTHNMIYLIFLISVLLYYTLQVSFNTMTVLRSAVRGPGLLCAQSFRLLH